MRSHRPRPGSGQSTVEFALMLPIMMLVFFWMFEADILMTGMQMTSYASFMSARAYVTAPAYDQTTYAGIGPTEPQAEQWTNGIADEILVGRLFRGGGAGFNAKGSSGPVWAACPPSLGSPDQDQMCFSTTQDRVSAWQNGQCQGGNVKDGVVVGVPQLGSLPYARMILQVPFRIPTHLGPNEYLCEQNDPNAAVSTDAKATDNNPGDFGYANQGGFNNQGPTQGGSPGHGNNGNHNGFNNPHNPHFGG